MSVRPAPWMRRRSTWLIAGAAVALGVASTAAAGATGTFRHTSSSLSGATAGCRVPDLAGSVVDITVTDMGMARGPGAVGGGMMGGGPSRAGMGRMGMTASPSTVTAGTVSLRVANLGVRAHEVLVLPLSFNQSAGQRVTGSDGRVDETAGLAESSRSCAAGAGDGIAPHTTGWVTLTLAPGHYELLCNIAGHYQAGAYTELHVT